MSADRFELRHHADHLMVAKNGTVVTLGPRGVYYADNTWWLDAVWPEGVRQDDGGYQLSGFVRLPNPDDPKMTDPCEPHRDWLDSDFHTGGNCWSRVYHTEPGYYVLGPALEPHHRAYGDTEFQCYMVYRTWWVESDWLGGPQVVADEGFLAELDDVPFKFPECEDSLEAALKAIALHKEMSK